MEDSESKVCVNRLSNAIRHWLKESKLQRFVRDVIKLVKLNKIYNKYYFRTRALRWFEDYKPNRFSSPKSKGSPVADAKMRISSPTTNIKRPT